MTENTSSQLLQWEFGVVDLIWPHMISYDLIWPDLSYLVEPPHEEGDLHPAGRGDDGRDGVVVDGALVDVGEEGAEHDVLSHGLQHPAAPYQVTQGGGPGEGLLDLLLWKKDICSGVLSFFWRLF